MSKNKAKAKKVVKSAKIKKPAPKIAAKPVKSAKPSAPGAKKSPKTAAKEVSKVSVLAAKPAKDQKKKKVKAPNEMNFEDYSDEDLAREATNILEEFKNKSPEEVEALRSLLGETIGEDEEVEIALRDAEGRLYCRMRECDELATVDSYCRFHYLKLWKKIQFRKKILTDGKLEKYIEELTLRYPDKYIEMIREDLKSEKKFLETIQELEIEDASEDIDVEESDELLEEVRGIQSVNTDDDDGGF